MEGHNGSARGLFWASVWHLPVVMVLAMVHKKGLWEGVWKRLNGESETESLGLNDDDEDVRILRDSDGHPLRVARVLASTEA